MRIQRLRVRKTVANDLFQHICEAAPDGIVVVASDGRIVMANACAEKQFGYSRDELLGAPIEQLVPDSVRHLHARHRSSYVSHPTSRPMGSDLRLLAQRRDGSEFPVEISLSPFESEGDRLIVAIVRDITDRAQLEKDREHLRNIADTERERQRIAMDLHDGIIQSIYAATLQLEAAVEDVRVAPDAAVTSIDRTIDQLNDTIRDIRSYILDLRPARYGGDLVTSLEEMLAEFRANSLIETTVDIVPSLPQLTESQESAIFHVAQEALNNARKHSRASRLSLSLQSVDGLIRLVIRDNGAGFDPTIEVPQDHRGMRNMLERAGAAEGAFRVETDPGAGTRVTLELPVERGDGGLK